MLKSSNENTQFLLEDRYSSDTVLISGINKSKSGVSLYIHGISYFTGFINLFPLTPLDGATKQLCRVFRLLVNLLNKQQFL